MPRIHPQSALSYVLYANLFVVEASWIFGPEWHPRVSLLRARPPADIIKRLPHSTPAAVTMMTAHPYPAALVVAQRCPLVTTPSRCHRLDRSDPVPQHLPVASPRPYSFLIDVGAAHLHSDYRDSVRLVASILRCCAVADPRTVAARPLQAASPPPQSAFRAQRPLPAAPDALLLVQRQTCTS